MAFVDVRLHVPVRPYLETVLPLLGLVVRDAILGDIDVAIAHRALARLTASSAPSARQHRRRAVVVEPREHAIVAELRASSDGVCAHVRAYLEQLQSAWCEFLSRLAEGTAHEVRVVRTQLEAARRDGSASEAEVRGAARRLHDHVDEYLARARAMACPTIARPPELVEATLAMRDRFARSYGAIRTPTLLGTKDAVEHSLCALQTPIAAAFVKRVTALLLHCSAVPSLAM